MNLPQAFVNRMRTLLGREADAFFASLLQPPMRALRVNLNKLSAERFQALCPFPLASLPFTSDGFLCSVEKAGAMPEHHAGMFYMQDPSAMSTIHAVSGFCGATVLDLCAAPGGKSSQLSSMIGDFGFLVSNEYNGGRCRILAGNLERLGCKNTMVTNASPAQLAAWYPNQFDLVVADAPCSGEGMFRKEPRAIAEWSEENVRACAKRQADILDSAAVLVRDGGELLYSTCTFAPEEDEQTVDAFLQRHEEFSLIPVEEPLRRWTADGVPFAGCRTDNITETRRVYPHLTGGEGQFIARMRKAGERSRASAPQWQLRSSLSLPANDETKIAKAFLAEMTEEKSSLWEPYCICRFRDNLVLLPKSFSMPVADHCVFSVGVTLGAVEKGRLVPHHAFFMAFGNALLRQLELAPGDPRLTAYLKGEEIPVSPETQNGYIAVLTQGCTLGFGKVVNGRLKNHYPKGLRLIG